jgi:hypothetical protein
MRINLDKTFRRLERLHEQRSTLRKQGRHSDDPEIRATYNEECRIEMRLLTHLDNLITQAVAEPEKPLDPAINEIATCLHETYDEELEEEGRYGEAYLSSRISRMNENLCHIQDGANQWLFGASIPQAAEDRLERRIENWTAVCDRLAAERAVIPEAQERQRQKEHERWERDAKATYVKWLEGVQPHIARMAPALADQHGKSEDQMKRFMSWYGRGYADWILGKGDLEGSGLFDTSPETMEQWIWSPVEYHRSLAEQHQAAAERGDEASLIDWDWAVRDRWDEFERELAEAA